MVKNAAGLRRSDLVWSLLASGRLSENRPMRADEIFFSSGGPLRLTVDTFCPSFFCRHSLPSLLRPLPFSPSLKFSPPLPLSVQYPVFSPFSFPPDQFSSLHPFPFSQPLFFFLSAPPPISHPSSTLHSPPPLLLLPRTSSPLSSSCCLCWQSGRRRRLGWGGGTASCICCMHYSCALQSVCGSRYSAGFSPGHTAITPLCAGRPPQPPTLPRKNCARGKR